MLIPERSDRPAPIVDHHQHVFGPAAALLVAGREGAAEVIDGEDVLRLLDFAGIERGVVLSVAYMFGSPARTIADELALVRAENDWAATQAAASPERLCSFFSINPLKPYALAEIDRNAGRSPSHMGLKLHFGNSDVRLDEVEHVATVRRVFARANELAMPIVVHLRPSISRGRSYGMHHARVFVQDVLPDAPDVLVQVAHLAAAGPGYDDPPAREAMAYLADAAARGEPSTRHLWFDVATVANEELAGSLAAELVQLIRKVGVSRVLYGSDAALGSNLRPAEAWAAFRRLPLTNDEVREIAGNVAPYVR